MNNLRYNLLTYIAYALDGRFRYDKVSFDFAGLGIAHEPATLRKEFSLLKKNGLITFRLRYRKPFPILTNAGKLEIKTRLAFKKYGTWDNKWRVVLFDLPQYERKYRLLLVEELTKIGFAPLQRGAYISPYSLFGVVEKLANHWGIRQHLSLLTVEKISAVSANEENIAKKWHLQEINDKYNDFMKMSDRIQRHVRLWPLQAKILEQTFADIFALDPHLPKELLPDNWHSTEAYAKFKEIANSY